MRRFALVPFSLLALTPFASASLVSYRVSGVVSDASTRNAFGGPIAPSVVTDAYPVGTTIDLTFSYDPAAVPLTSYGAGHALYDVPYAVSGRIGTRAVSANAGTIAVYDSGSSGDVLSFAAAVGDTTAGVTPVRITESSPFTGSGYALTAIRFNLGRPDGNAFSGTALPASLDATLLQQNGFGFTYQNASSGNFATVSGTLRSITPVPEPASLAALGLGLAALARRRRSR